MRLTKLALVFWIVAPQIGALSFRAPQSRSLEPREYRCDPMFHVLSPDEKKAYEAERDNWINEITTEKLYSSPPGWEHSPPGTVLRSELVDTAKMEIPKELELYRLLYVSLDHNDNRVPASTYVLFPCIGSDEQKPSRVVVWAHGTAGIERHCAPSNNRRLYYGPSIDLALRGYAVIAPDYAGLGSNSTFHYVSAPGHAADVSLAVIAARAKFQNRLTQEWVTVGHSEGGLTAWAVDEREVTKPTGGFLGTVSIAPALQTMRIIRYGLEHGGLGHYSYYSSYHLSAIARFNDSVDETQIYTDEGMKRMCLGKIGCIRTAGAVFDHLPFNKIYKDIHWPESAWATSWQDRMGVKGDKPLAKPLLLVQGLTDTAVYPNVTKDIFNEHCQSHPDSQVHLSLYPNYNHDSVLRPSKPEVFQWIEDRFNGKPVRECCSTRVVTQHHTD